jgi:hypothetical protein
MRFCAWLLVIGFGVVLAGCAASTPLKSNAGPSQASGGTSMFDPPLSVPPGFNAPPLETPASVTPPAAGDSSQPPATGTASAVPAAGSDASQPSATASAAPAPSSDTLLPPVSGTASAAPATGADPLQPPTGGVAGTAPATGSDPLQAPAIGLAGTAPADLGASAAPASSPGGSTPGEQAFLDAAGASDVDPNIRAEIDAANRAAVNPAFVDSLIFGPSTPASATGAEIKRSTPGMLDTLF